MVPSGLVTAAYLGRTLGPEFYGLFAVATAVSVTLEWAIISLFARATVKLLAEAEDWRPVASTILIVHLAAGLLIAAAFWAGAGRIAHLLGDVRLAPWLALLALEVPIATTAAACRNILTGRGEFRGRAIATGVRWVVRPVAIVVFVEAGWSVTGAVIGSLTAATAGLIVAMTMARVPVFKTSRAPLVDLWRLAVPMFVLALSLRLIEKLGLFAVQALGSSPAEAGWYAAAQNMAIAPGLVALSFSPLLLAELTRARAEGQPDATRALVAQALRVVVALLPCVAIGAGSAHEIVRLVYGAGFDAAAHLSRPLLLAAFAMLLISVTTAVLIAADRASAAALCVWPMLPAAALAMALVVPHAGAYGAAVITAAALSFSAGGCLVMLGRTVGVWPPVDTVTRSAVIALVVGTAAAWWNTPGLEVVVKLAVLTALTPLAFAVAGEFAGPSPGGFIAAGVDGPDSGPYWDRVAADWHGAEVPDGWRAHSDAVNLAACARWWPQGSVGRVLKTDLFDEVAGRGLVPALHERASSMVAIDRSFEASRVGGRRSGASVVNADVRYLPFVSGAFDLVVSNSTLDHFDDVAQIERAVVEIHRVLAPGGLFILTLDNPANPVVALRNALPFALLQHVGLVPYYVGATLAGPDAQRMLQAAGFRVRETTALMHCPRALAVAVFGIMRRFGNPSMQRRLQSWLMWFERFERSAIQRRTGYFVALVADKGMA